MGQAAIPQDSRIAVVWRERVTLPELGIPAVEAVADMGARTFALHIFDLTVFHDKGAR